jgi:hypothetical protein
MELAKTETVRAARGRDRRAAATRTRAAERAVPTRPPLEELGRNRTPPPCRSGGRARSASFRGDAPTRRQERERDAPTRPAVSQQQRLLLLLPQRQQVAVGLVVRIGPDPRVYPPPNPPVTALVVRSPLRAPTSRCGQPLEIRFQHELREQQGFHGRTQLRLCSLPPRNCCGEPTVLEYSGLRGIRTADFVTRSSTGFAREARRAVAPSAIRSTVHDERSHPPSNVPDTPAPPSRRTAAHRTLRASFVNCERPTRALHTTTLIIAART